MPHMASYTIRSGDTLSAIAARFHTTVAQLAKANGIKNVNAIRAGAKLKVPDSFVETKSAKKPKKAKPAPKKPTGYRVRAGDTLPSIAKKHNTTAQALAELNGITTSTKLVAGMTLQLPGAKKAAAAKHRKDNPATRKPPQVPGKWSKFAHLMPYHFNNSPQGLKAARKKGYKGIDLDAMISKDGVVVNTHWADVLKRGGFYDPKKKLPKNITVKKLNADQLFSLKSKGGYSIHSMEEMFKLAKKEGLRVEFELKGSKGFEYGHGGLTRLKEMKAIADRIGVQVQVKTISTTPGAKARLKAAHRAGFTTFVLPRGDRKIPKSWWPFVDYVRGPVKWV